MCGPFFIVFYSIDFPWDTEMADRQPVYSVKPKTFHRTLLAKGGSTINK